jgi:galactokinase
VAVPQVFLPEWPPPEGLAGGFAESFGGDPELVAWAPGRVNLVGEHTDYNEGWVLPAAIGLGTWVAARPARGACRLVSATHGPAPGFDAAACAPGEELGWAAYPAGVAWAMRDRVQAAPIEAYVWSDLPAGSGLSSSAALGVAFGTLWNAMAGAPLSPLEVALAAQRAENGFVGVQCGAMDPMASALGVPGHALLIDARTLQAQPVALPEDAAIVVCDTGTPRSLAGSVYNQRRAECEEASRLLGVPSLRDATWEALDRAGLPPVLHARARHVLEENERVLAAAEALQAGDRAALGALFEASHESLRNNFEVTTVELDTMAATARRGPGCWAARMTGAGMGGACVALLGKNSVEQFMDAVRREYLRAIHGGSPSFLAVGASGGASVGPWIWPSASNGLAGKKTGS